MAHIFRPGDRAYSLRTLRWVELIENGKDTSGFYPLKGKDSDETYLRDGRYDKMQGAPCLVPLNPYDPTDPNNPPEFRYPFMLNGRPVFEGGELHNLGYGKTSAVTSLFLEDGKQWCGMKNTSVGELVAKNFCWPDELPTKKKVAKWAYLVVRIPGKDTVGFSEEMTEEEARKAYGSSVQMVPGTEREVEG